VSGCIEFETLEAGKIELFTLARQRQNPWS
jgi:hypothetical protein